MAEICLSVCLSVSLPPPCDHVCVIVCVCACAHVCGSACGSQKSTLGVISQAFFLNRVFYSPETWQLGEVGRRVRCNDPPVSHPPRMDYKQTTPYLCHRFWGLNSGLLLSWWIFDGLSSLSTLQVTSYIFIDVDEPLNADCNKICSAPGFACFSGHFGWHPLLYSPRFLPVIYCPSTASQTELFKTTSCLIFAESLPVGHSLPQHGIPRLELPTPHQFWQGRESSLQSPCYAHQTFSGSFASNLADTLVLATLMKKKKNHYFLMNYY